MTPTPAQLNDLAQTFDNRPNAPAMDPEAVVRMVSTLWNQAEKLVPLHPMREGERAHGDMPDEERRKLVFTVAKEALRTGGRATDFERAGQFVEATLNALGYHHEDHFKRPEPFFQPTDTILFRAFNNRPERRRDAAERRAAKNRETMRDMIQRQQDAGRMDAARAEWLRENLDHDTALTAAITDFRAVIEDDTSLKRADAAKKRKKV